MAAGRRADLRLGLFPAAVVSSLYLPWIFHDIAFKTGNPDTIDVVMGTS